jgi:phosphatidate cytidylyltransferase
MATVVVLLAVTTITVLLVKRRQPHREYRQLIQRIKSWWIIVVLFLGVLAISKGAAIIFFALVSYLALKEYFSLIPTRRADRRAILWGYIAILIQYLLVYREELYYRQYGFFRGEFGVFTIFIPVFMFFFLPVRLVLIGETKGFLKAAGTLYWGLMMSVFSLSHLALLLVLTEDVNPVARGAGLVFYLVCLTELNDVFQFIWGTLLGRRKVVPNVSPNKTWAGLLGGVGTTIVLACLLAPLLTPFSTYHAILAGAIISIGGFLGDITVSAIKRDLDIKDSGILLPGHGGILDRVDSLIFTAPLFFYFTTYNYVQ